jgi:thiol-disulfide isomerase/thioredoxin
MRALWILLILLGSCKEKIDSKPEPLKKVQEVEFVDMNGDTFMLSAFKGKRILVNYWAPWCIPCKWEFPSLIKAQEKLKDDNYVFLFPTIHEFDQIQEFKTQNGYDIRFLKMDATLAQMNVNVLPTTVIYGTDGELYKQINGALEWDKDEIINMLKEVP